MRPRDRRASHDEDRRGAARRAEVQPRRRGGDHARDAAAPRARRGPTRDRADRYAPCRCGRRPGGARGS
eukprot:7561384-Pyramimonas_sp.AAC.1